MIILLHRVNDSLTGSEIHRAPACDRERRRASLRGVFTFGLDRDFLLAPDVEFAHRVGALINFAAFGRRRDRIKHAAFGDAGFDPLRDELIAVTGDANAGISWGGSSGLSFLTRAGSRS